MDSNPYQPPPETPHPKRPTNLPRWILAASLATALLLISLDAPTWLVILAGAGAALAAEEWIRGSWG